MTNEQLAELHKDLRYLELYTEDIESFSAMEAFRRIHSILETLIKAEEERSKS